MSESEINHPLSNLDKRWFIFQFERKRHQPLLKTTNNLNSGSITEIIRKVGNKKWIEKRELKLPKTTQVINEKLETLEDFMIRKLKFAEEKFIKKKSVPTREQLIRQATINNLTTYNSDRIQNEIAVSLRKIENSI